MIKIATTIISGHLNKYFSLKILWYIINTYSLLSRYILYEVSFLLNLKSRHSNFNILQKICFFVFYWLVYLCKTMCSWCNFSLICIRLLFFPLVFNFLGIVRFFLYVGGCVCVCVGVGVWGVGCVCVCVCVILDDLLMCQIPWTMKNT